MNAPKNRQSDERNNHIASLALGTPVCAPGPVRVLSGGGGPAGTRSPPPAADVCSIVAIRSVDSSGLRPGLEAPGEGAEQQEEQPGDEPQLLGEHGGVPEARETQRDDQR